MASNSTESATSLKRLKSNDEHYETNPDIVDPFGDDNNKSVCENVEIVEAASTSTKKPRN